MISLTHDVLCIPLPSSETFEFAMVLIERYSCSRKEIEPEYFRTNKKQGITLTVFRETPDRGKTQTPIKTAGGPIGAHESP